MLKARNVKKNFGGLAALDGIDLEVKQGSIVGLIGPNGSGKTTFFNVVSGFLPADAGEVIFKDKILNGKKPYEINKMGLGRTFQICRIFPKMTVLENMLVAPKGQVGESIIASFLKWRKVKEEELKLAKRAEEILKFLDLYHLRDEYAYSLSGGQRKLLELGRVLMGNPELILLDEPVAGVNPTLSLKIFEKVKELRKNGITFLIIEHNIDVLTSICDWIYVMHRGKIVYEGSPYEVQTSQKVIDIYLGG